MRAIRLRLAILASFDRRRGRRGRRPDVDAQGDDGFRFKSGVELVNVTATVSDDDGRFVSGLTKDDFTSTKTASGRRSRNFSNERVPVSLGILLDTSGSMTPDKMSAARSAIDRFIYDLLGQGRRAVLHAVRQRARPAAGLDDDRRAISRAVGQRRSPAGGTAMYDAIASALPIAADGRNQKKAILVISDGNDTNSRTSVGELRQLIRESEVMVYALGVDGTDVPTYARSRASRAVRGFRSRFRRPRPFPGGRFPLVVAADRLSADRRRHGAGPAANA